MSTKHMEPKIEDYVYVELVNALEAAKKYLPTWEIHKAIRDTLYLEQLNECEGPEVVLPIVHND